MIFIVSLKYNQTLNGFLFILYTGLQELLQWSALSNQGSVPLPSPKSPSSPSHHPSSHRHSSPSSHTTSPPQKSDPNVPPYIEDTGAMKVESGLVGSAVNQSVGGASGERGGGASKSAQSHDASKIIYCPFSEEVRFLYEYTMY